MHGLQYCTCSIAIIISNLLMSLYVYIAMIAYNITIKNLTLFHTPAINLYFSKILSSCIATVHVSVQDL